MNRKKKERKEGRKKARREKKKKKKKKIKKKKKKKIFKKKGKRRERKRGASRGPAKVEDLSSCKSPFPFEASNVHRPWRAGMVGSHWT